MSDRNAFAAFAMQALIEHQPELVNSGVNDDHQLNLIAWQAFRIADAMVKEGRVQEVKHGDA